MTAYTVVMSDEQFRIVRTALRAAIATAVFSSKPSNDYPSCDSPADEADMLVSMINDMLDVENPDPEMINGFCY